MQRHEVFDDWTRIRNDWTRIRNDWTRIRDGWATTFTFHHTIYSGQELRDRMEQVEFVDVKLYMNLDGGTYDHRAERLIAVGRHKQ